MSNKISVIGLGTAGCNIAEKFRQYPNYRIYKIGSDLEKDKYNYVLPRYENPEDYEKNIPKLKTFFRLVQGEVLFIVGGSGLSSNASLVILNQIKHCKISLLYIKPESDLLSEKQEMMDRVVYNVLQEYTRSGVFEQIYLVQNNIIEDMLGTIPIKEYFDKINDVIVYALNMIRIYDNLKPVVSNMSPPRDISRIVTLGAIDLASGEESLFFPMENIREKYYYYMIKEEDINSNKTLFKDIRNQIKEKKEDTTKVCYAIHSTDFDQNYAFVVARSSEIQ